MLTDCVNMEHMKNAIDAVVFPPSKGCDTDETLLLNLVYSVLNKLEGSVLF